MARRERWRQWLVVEKVLVIVVAVSTTGRDDGKVKKDQWRIRGNEWTVVGLPEEKEKEEEEEN